MVHRFRYLFILVVTASTMNTPSLPSDEFAQMQKMMRESPKQAQVLESEGKFEQAGKLYEDLAKTVERTETQPRKIFAPIAFGLYAQFLERRSQQTEAMQWYEKIATMPVNAHAYKVKSENMLRYAALLKKAGDKQKAQKVEAEAKKLSETQKRLNASGADY